MRLHELDYSQIFKPETVNLLKQKSKESYSNLLKKFGGPTNPQMFKALSIGVAKAEEGYEDELGQLAVEAVKEAYPIVQDMIDRGELVIDAKIEKFGTLKMPPPPPEEEPEEQPEEPEYGPEDEDKLAAKRRIVNAISHGSAIRGAYAFHLFKDYLDSINPELLESYNTLLDTVFGIYDNENAIAAMLATINQKKDNPGGYSDAQFDEENDRFIIVARGINLPTLIHEIVKGLYSAIGMSMWSSNKELNQKVVGKVDTLENEPEDLQLGKFIFDKIQKLWADSGYDDSRIRDYFISDLYKDPSQGGLDTEEFVSFIENLIHDNLTSQQKRWAKDTMDEISSDLTKDDSGLTGLDEEFEADFPSAFEGEEQAIDDYVSAVQRHTPQGITMVDAMEDVPDAAHSLQLKILVALAKKGLLNMSTGRVKIRPNEVFKIFDDTFGIAVGTMLDKSKLNENKRTYGTRKL